MESYRTSGNTCSKQILFEVDENGILTDLKFLGGCAGGLQAISRFSIGKPIDEIIKICKGIQCKNGTSCPDQLAEALIAYKKHLEDLKNGIIQPTSRGSAIKFTVQIVSIKKQ